jgi:hypothetical protein
MNFSNMKASKHGIRIYNNRWIVEEHAQAHELCCHHVRLALAHIDWIIENDPDLRAVYMKQSHKKSTKKSSKKSHK